MQCFYRSNGTIRPYDENTNQILNSIAFAGLIKEIVLFYPPHHIDFSLKTVTDLKTGETYTLIFGQPTEQYPDGIGVLTQAQLNDYARLC